MKELDKVLVDKVIRELGQQKAANHLGVSRSTLRDFAYRNGLATRKDPKDKASVVLKEDEVEITSDATTDVSDPEQIVRDRGLNPKEWEFTGMTVNEWDSPTGEKLKQLKVHLKRIKQAALILPARTEGPKFKPPKKQKIAKEGSLFVFLGDQQAPYQDEHLHEKVCLFLESQKPHTIVNIGDTSDFPDISKYKSNPERHKPVQTCINSGYGVLRDQRIASPNSVIKKIIGNHDFRLRDFLLHWVPELYGLKRAEIDTVNEVSIFSPAFLLRLDELGIDLIGDNDNWEHGQFNVSKYLAARHGWISTKGSGSSALKTLEALGFSIIVGHTHRLSKVYKTMHDIDGNKTILTAAESGCLCRVDITGLGFAPAPDWQNGFATATVYPDGYFNVDLATFVSGDLIWRDSRW